MPSHPPPKEVRQFLADFITFAEHVKKLVPGDSSLNLYADQILIAAQTAAKRLAAGLEADRKRYVKKENRPR